MYNKSLRNWEEIFANGLKKEAYPISVSYTHLAISDKVEDIVEDIEEKVED